MANRYAYSKCRAPIRYGQRTFSPEMYTVVDESLVQPLKEAKFAMEFEGDPDWKDIWVRNYPEKTPQQLLPLV